MKRLLAILFAAVMVFTLTACGEGKNLSGQDETTLKKENTVTIHIPKTITMTLSGDPQDMVIGPAEHIFEDGWQEKDSFTVTYLMPIEGMPQNVTTTYANGKATATVTAQDKEISRSEIIYNGQGKVASQVTYTAAEQVEKTENKYTYDEKGRTITLETIVHYIDVAPVSVKHEFTITEIDDGSVGVYISGGMEYRYTYDKNDRLVSNVTTVNSQELSRTEFTYDDFGNVLTQTQITATTNSAEAKIVTAYTYEAVTVSTEKAAKLKWWK